MVNADRILMTRNERPLRRSGMLRTFWVLLLGAVLTLGAAACGDGEEPVPSPTPPSSDPGAEPTAAK